jgi:hypothetical protein
VPTYVIPTWIVFDVAVSLAHWDLLVNILFFPLHRFPLLRITITVLKFGTLYVGIGIRVVELTIAIHTNSIRKVHHAESNASVSITSRKKGPIQPYNKRLDVLND